MSSGRRRATRMRLALRLRGALPRASQDAAAGRIRTPGPGSSY
eukprot:COSAG01_NODE_1479_length_10161_cov_138.934109_6_plen_43_part_00